MKYTTNTKMTIAITLDSSEAVMFTKGGKHEIVLSNDLILDEFDEVVLSFQLERNEQGRFNHVFGEAQKHKEQKNC